MRQFFLTLVLLLSSRAFAAPDVVSAYMNDVLVRGKAILEVKDESDRNLQMCGHLRQNLGSELISSVWLGHYQTLTRDQAGIDNFRYMIPSI